MTQSAIVIWDGEPAAPATATPLPLPEFRTVRYSNLALMAFVTLWIETTLPPPPPSIMVRPGSAVWLQTPPPQV